MIIHADCVEAMQAMEPNSVDAIVCDPPYGLEFMGKEWDALGGGRQGQPGIGERPTDWPDARGWNEKRCVKCGHLPHGGSPCRCESPRYALDRNRWRMMQEWHQAWATEALRVLKPGGHLLAFGGTRTYHRLACAVEDAGFEIRDSLLWIYATGFPKSLDVSKAIDKAAGARDDESIGFVTAGDYGERELAGPNRTAEDRIPGGRERIAPVTPEAQHWQGWGTALKPAHEPIVVARKPLVGTVSQNVLEHGTGALNIDATRIESEGHLRWSEPRDMGYHGGTDNGSVPAEVNPAGRWPPNVTLSHLPECKQTGSRKVKGHPGYPNGPQGNRFSVGDDPDGSRTEAWAGHADSDGTETVPEYRCAPSCPVAELDRQSGERRSAGEYEKGANGIGDKHGAASIPIDGLTSSTYSDTGGASRFFYVAKASRAERNAGLEGFEERAKRVQQSDGRQLVGQAESMATRNPHPTVKPIALMRWLVKLVTPKGGTVLDPFTGSGSTGVAAVLEGFDFVGIERETEYVALAEARVAFWAQFPGADVDKVLLSDARAREIEASGQLGLL